MNSFKIFLEEFWDDDLNHYPAGLIEGKQVGIIYHFTKYPNFLNILDSDFKMTTLSGAGVVSFTRNRFAWNVPGSDIAVMNPNVALVIDGDKLSNKYKIVPVAGAYDPASPNPFQKGISRVPKDWGEAEEAVIIPKSGSVDVSKAIKGVAIKANPKDIPEKVKTKLNAMNIELITGPSGRKAFHMLPKK